MDKNPINCLTFSHSYSIKHKYANSLTNRMLGPCLKCFTRYSMISASLNVDSHKIQPCFDVCTEQEVLKLGQSKIINIFQMVTKLFLLDSVCPKKD